MADLQEWRKVGQCHYSTMDALVDRSVVGVRFNIPLTVAEVRVRLAKSSTSDHVHRFKRLQACQGGQGRSAASEALLPPA